MAITESYVCIMEFGFMVFKPYEWTQRMAQKLLSKKKINVTLVNNNYPVTENIKNIIIKIKDLKNSLIEKVL